MSRCFPYPQPGYEKKARDASIIILKDSKRDKEKKRRDKKKRNDGEEEKKKKHRSREEKLSKKEGGEQLLERGLQEDRKRKPKEGREDADKQTFKQADVATPSLFSERNGLTLHSSSGDGQPSLSRLRDSHSNGELGGGTGKMANGWLSSPKKEADSKEHLSDDKSRDRGNRSREKMASEVEPPGEMNGRGEEGEGLDDDSWLFRPRPRLRGDWGSSSSSSGVVGLALADPRYLPEFDVCILPYMLPYCVRPNCSKSCPD